MSSDTVLCWAILASVTYFDSRRCKNAAKTSKNWQEQSSRKVPNLIKAQCYAYSQCAVPVPNQYSMFVFKGNQCASTMNLGHTVI